MPKSRVRGGKKTHRKKVKIRNQKIKSTENKFRNMFQEELMKELEREKQRMEETKTEIVEVVDVEEKGV